MASKYDSQLQEVKQVLQNAKSILIALPKDVTADQLSSGLALYLSLKEAQKEVSVLTEGTIRVGHTNLFGVGDIKDKMPEGAGGNFTITLGGVIDPVTQKPSALEKLEWFPVGNDLKLVFYVLPGQKFEPSFVTPSREGGEVDLIFVVGVAKPDDLGSLYSAKKEFFEKSLVVNIDNQSSNQNFGKTNIIDTSASSLSEIVAQIIPGLRLHLDGDIASNILAGIFAATDNLTGANATADTFEVVANSLRAGGRKPSVTVVAEEKKEELPQPQMGFQAPVTPQPVVAPQGTFDLSKLTGVKENEPAEAVIVEEAAKPQENIPSAEEAPQGEQAQSIKPEDDWLTPKIFKGSSLG